MNIDKFRKQPILGILRDITKEDVPPLFEMIISSGLASVEIAMNTKDAAALIKQAVNLSKGKLWIGAGTVVNMKLLKSAISAGASFIVMPVLVKDVVKYCVRHKIPVFPGALSPQEIYQAWDAGAAMVKVFPAGFFGPKYFREIKGPFKDIELLACGGVTPENMPEYFLNGASAIAFGASVFRKEWLAKKDFPRIREAIKKFLGK
jgi:2-dehydro-3-deoxyphosphogluconate aldolase/(4S)-4-hydroxy-2-oxoglutarate aldolase